jgi:predicted ABC-type ATPase
VINPPVLTILAGPNGSGKSTFYKRFNHPAAIKHPFVNADNYLKGYKELKFFSEPGKLIMKHMSCSVMAVDYLRENHPELNHPEVNFYSAEADELFAAQVATEVRYTLLFAKESFDFETVLSTNEKLEFIKLAKELGYVVKMYFFYTTSPNINIARIAKRVTEGGHNVPDDRVVKRYAKSLDMLTKVAPYVDTLHIIDNSFEYIDMPPSFITSTTIYNNNPAVSIDVRISV